MRHQTPVLLFVLIALFSGAVCQADSIYTEQQMRAESARANLLFNKAFERNIADHPELAATLGKKIRYDEWDDRSDAQDALDLAQELRDLAEIKRTINFDMLDAQTQLSYRLFEYNVERDAEAFKYRFDSYPVNQMYGVHTALPVFLMNLHRIDNVSDAKAYIARVKKIPHVIEQLLVNLKTRADKGVIAPKFVFPLVIDATRKAISGAPFETGPASPLQEDFSKKVGALKNVSSVTKARLILDLKSALLDSLKPSYEKLIAYLQELEKRATDDAGVWKFPDGEEFYASALRRTTTTNLSADEIHQIGLSEVARIHEEMNRIKDKVGFKGDLQAFFKFMREDKQFYLPDTEAGKSEYLSRATKIIDTMRANLDKLFITKPKAEINVKAVEKFRENSAGTAFYQPPSIDGKRPGVYYVKLARMDGRPTYEMEALAFHEGIPGHHMQIAIAQELKNLPEFRKVGRYTAYVEGWGLYSELTPKEIGFYQDPYSDFGRLSMEIWRAARLVVDTGIHHKRWTRQQAIDYLKNNTPSSDAGCEEAINRYIVLPSQATAYKIGMLKIVELREKAKKQLGDRFDIRKFHEVILANGALPLDFLEENVNNWIEGQP